MDDITDIIALERKISQLQDLADSFDAEGNRRIDIKLACLMLDDAIEVLSPPPTA